ncbi:Nn.00g050620.m01.CDS01 [Neocucurbitaria sp. VM-36]
MSYVPHYNSHLTTPDGHEQLRIPRVPIANASSTRSRSAPGAREDASRGRHSPGPSTGKQSIDSSSQITATSTGVVKTSAGVQVANVPDIERGNPRTDSDPSSHGSRRPDLGDWDENKASVPRTNLTILDVAALILNKQIGTGIFTTPGAVLLSTRSKGLSVALWTIGGFWTLMFLLVYLEFGNALPFNGGELVYLDEIYRRPELLATILFSGFFLLLANSYGNSVQFAKHVLIAAMPGLDNSKELDPRLVRYLAISVVTFVCLIHWFSSRAGLFLNKLVAWYKTILLLVVFIAGMVYSEKHGSQWNDPIDRGSAKDGMAGMVLIFYSYQGWENANYVAGEIRAFEGRTSRRTLNIGAFLGVTTVWVLYVLVTVALYRVLDYELLTGPNSDLAAALQFAPRVFGASTAFKICMAISALGNVLAVTYTASKVKQSIAIQRILPFWHYLQKDDKTPKGALVLHWITSVIFIAAAPTSSDGYSFAIGLYTYGHVLVSIFVALGLLRLQKRMQCLPNNSNYQLTFFRAKLLLYTVPIIFALGNLLILIFAGKTHITGKIPRWWWPITIFLLLLASALYWAGMRVTMIKTSIKDDTTGDKKTVGDLIGFKVDVYYKDSDHVPPVVEKDIDEALAAKVDGSKRRVVVQTSGRIAGMGTRFDVIKDFSGRYLF